MSRIKLIYKKISFIKATAENSTLQNLSKKISLQPAVYENITTRGPNETNDGPCAGVEQIDKDAPGWIAFIVIKTLITIAGLVSNLTTFITLALNSKGFSKINRLLLQHQAIVDTFICIMGITHYTQDRMWMTANDGFNLLVCQFWHTTYLYWAIVFVSVWNVVFITVERFILINFPLKHRNITPKHLFIVFPFFWFFGFLFLGPAFTLKTYDKENQECLSEMLLSTTEWMTFLSYLAIILMFVVYVLPIAIFIGLYTKTLVTLRQKRETNKESHILKIADQQMTRTAIAVAIVFIISMSWDNIGSALFYSGLICNMPNTWPNDVGVFLAALNSCANPLIYAVFLAAFRKSLRKTFKSGVDFVSGDSSNKTESTQMALTQS